MVLCSVKADASSACAFTTLVAGGVASLVSVFAYTVQPAAFAVLPVIDGVGVGARNLRSSSVEELQALRLEVQNSTTEIRSLFNGLQATLVKQGELLEELAQQTRNGEEQLLGAVARSRLDASQERNLTSREHRQLQEELAEQLGVLRSISRALHTGGTGKKTHVGEGLWGFLMTANSSRQGEA
jgi:hypothetical protein